MMKKYTFVVALVLVAMFVALSGNVNAAVTEINTVEINNATLTITEGVNDTSVFTAVSAYPELYTIAWETWDDYTAQDFAVLVSDPEYEKLSYDFKRGNEYSYRIGIQLTEEALNNGYTFASNAKLILNGETLTDYEDFIQDDFVKTYFLVIVTPEEREPEVELQVIDTIRVSGINTNLYDGLVPKIKTEEGSVFTAVSEETDKYYVYVESWIEDGSYKEFTSSEFFNNDAHTNDGETLFTVFKGGKKYFYTVWVKPQEGYKFDENTKIVLNGTEFEIDPDAIRLFDEENVWFKSDSLWVVADGEEEPEEPDYDEYTNVYEDIPVHIMESDDDGYYPLENTATIEVEEGIKIVDVDCIDFDYYYFEYDEEELVEGYDAGAYIYIGWVTLIADEDTVMAKLTLPIPEIYDNKTVMIVIDDVEYLPVSVEDGYAIFELPITCDYGAMAYTYEEDYYAAYGKIFFKYATEEGVEDFDVVTGDTDWMAGAMFIVFALATVASALKFKKSM